MQDVTTLGFIQLLGRYGAPDLLFTEYFRVHGHSSLEIPIVDSILHHNTGKPIFAQLIGESLPDLERTVQAIHERELPVTGIDLNMGCPAPKVYKKNVGGGLLRDPQKIDQIFHCLKNCIQSYFTVKMRIGFESDAHFLEILDLIDQHQVDLLSLHARTVKGGYKSEVAYEYIAEAARRLSCPVLGNGNITSYLKADTVLKDTKSRGVMIGRSCIRNPWIFRQISEFHSQQPIYKPTFSAVRQYIEDLYELSQSDGREERFRINYLKKFLNFIGTSIDSDGQFLYQTRRCQSKSELDVICDRFLIDRGKADTLYPIEPLSGLVARPNCETANPCSL